MNILSLFGGIECGRVALDRLGIPVDKYFSSEIDPYAIKISSANYPDIIHIGDVKDIKYKMFYTHEGDTKTLSYKNGSEIKYNLAKIDLLIGGSPCQDLSIAKKNGKGLEGEKSGLFYEYVRILKEVGPKYFLLENVASMKKADKEKITEVLREVYLDTEVHMINSSLVSAQNRKRLYWTNIPGVTQPEDRGILLRDVLEDIPMDDERWKPLDEKYLTDKVKLQLREKSLAITASYHKKNAQNYFNKNEGQVIVSQKAYPVTATYAGACPRDFLQKHQRELILGLAHRNRGEGKQPECNLQEKANSMTTVQSDSEILGIFQKPRGKNSGGITYDGEKSPTITGSFEDNSKLLAVQDYIYLWRKLTPTECERLQTLPDGYTDHVSDSRRYKAIGNGWTVDVISHILSFIPQ